jgi:hypothetical protein
METKRLIPYSVHLREDIYNKLKEAAEGRKASGMVRDAITMFLDGKDAFGSGYDKGIQDAIQIMANDEMSNRIWVDGSSFAQHLADKFLLKIGAGNGHKKEG